MVRKFQDLVVWQKSMDLVTEIYRLTRSFPKEEIFGLISQLRRAAVSVPSNIAEG
jgi:four helix bundle protein